MCNVWSKPTKAPTNSISIINLKLEKLQKTNSKAQKLRQKKQADYQDIKGVLQHQSLAFVPEAIKTGLISHNVNYPLANHFSIEGYKIC